MNLGHLTSFLAVASTGSLTAAAKTLFITQPAISHHIKALEEALGVRLFVRHKSGMLLTVEGEELRDACRNVVDAASDISFQVQRINTLKRGRLTIALTSFLNSTLVSACLAFKKEYPGIKMNLRFNNSWGVIEAMKENEADIGFSCTVPTMPMPPMIASVMAHKEQLLLVAERSHPLSAKEVVTPEDLQECLFVTREVGTFTRMYTEQWFRPFSLPPNTIQTSRAESVRGLVLAGAVGIMPENNVRLELADGSLKALPAAGLQSWVDCSIYTNTARPLSRAARAFLRIALAEGCFSHGEALEVWLDEAEKDSG